MFEFQDLDSTRVTVNDGKSPRRINRDGMQKLGRPVMVVK
jgi:hypothetical protein